MGEDILLTYDVEKREGVEPDRKEEHPVEAESKVSLEDEIRNEKMKYLPGVDARRGNTRSHPEHDG